VPVVRWQLYGARCGAGGAAFGAFVFGGAEVVGAGGAEAASPAVALVP